MSTHAQTAEGLQMRSAAAPSRSRTDRIFFWVAVGSWLFFFALALLPALGASRYVVHLATLLALQAALATSLNLMIGYTGQFALSHAAFFGLGAYASALVIAHLGVSFWLSIPIAIVIVGVIALLVGLPAMRYTGGIHFALVTFGVGELLRLVAANWDDLTGGAQGLRITYLPEPVLGFDATSGRGFYLLALAVFFVALVTVALLRHSRMGRALVSIREDEVLASSLGVNVLRYKVSAFVISSMLAALAGTVYAPFIGFISPDMMAAHESVVMTGMLVVGGIGTLFGPILGVFVFFALPEILRVAKFYRLVLLGFVIVITVLFMPEGIMGAVRKRIARFRKGAH